MKSILISLLVLVALWRLRASIWRVTVLQMLVAPEVAGQMP